MARKAAAVTGGTMARRGGKATLVLFAAAVIAVTELPAFVVFVAGMVPTAVVLVVDRNPRRHLTWAVSVLNLSGLVLPLLKLWTIGVSLAGAQKLLSDPENWLIMYGTAGVGWLLCAAAPSVARVILDIRAQREERRLIRRGEEIAKEWGREVTGR